MDVLPFDQWALPWAISARKVSHGDVVAGLLVDLAGDPRGVYGVPTVVFPLACAARALGVAPLIVRTALHQLAEVGLLQFRAEKQPDESLMAVTLLPPPQPTPPPAATPDGQYLESQNAVGVDT